MHNTVNYAQNLIRITDLKAQRKGSHFVGSDKNVSFRSGRLIFLVPDTILLPKGHY